MKSTGMIRKIDELGRIVIPKEIRNNLKIKDNEAVEIYVEEDKMILQKYNQMLSYEDKCNKLINIFDKVFNLNIIITDTSKVLFLSKNCDSKFLNNEITKEFQNLIKERKIIINKEIENGAVVKPILEKNISDSIKKIINNMGINEEAKDKIEEQSLNVEKVEESSDKVEAGYVIRQDPEQNSEANSGETVKVYVSTGAKMITMENVVGSKEADAKTKLTKKGFEVDVVYEEDTSKDDGIVLKQSIDIGKEVKDGSKVTLTVNKIQALKEGTININLKSLLKYDTKADETANITDPTVSVSTVNIHVTADWDNVYKEDVR